MKLFFSLFLSLNVLCVVAQQKPVNVLKIPVKYMTSPDGEIANSAVERDGIKNWIVCSDRINNPTFSNKNGTGDSKTMGYLEPFWVSEDEGAFVHLYKLDINEFQLEEASAKKKGKQARLIKSIIDYGWAPKNKLLLWFRGVVNDKNLSKRVLPILKQENINDDRIKVNNGVIQLYKNPELSVVSEKSIRMFQFLFVYKEDVVNNTVLVGLNYKTSDRQLNNDILGWIHKDVLQSWGDRICLEPNWNSQAVDKRKALNTKTSIFNDLADAKSFKSGNSSIKAAWNNDPYETRMGPNEKRFPILSSETGVEGIVKTGFVTALFDGDKVVSTSAENAIITKEANLNILEKRKINLIVLVDGSAGMEEYVSAVKIAITKIKERIAKIKNLDDDLDDEDYFKYKFGAVVYRDIEDKNCGEDLSINTLPLTTEADNITDFLETQSKKSSCKPSEKNNGALYSGLYRALRMFKESQNFEKQTNIIIHIGGKVGTETEGLSTDKISDLMVQTNTHLMSFQVKTNQSSSYLNFTSKLKGIFDLAKDKYNLNAVATSKEQKSDVFTSQFKPFGTRCYKLDYPEGSTVQGVLAYSSISDFFPTSLIYDKVDSLMKGTEQKVEADIQELSSKINGIGNKKIKMNAVVNDFLAKLGKQVKDKDIIKKYKGNNYQFFIPGYTTLTTNSITETNSLYKRVLYLTLEELIEMKNSIGELNISETGSETRRKLKEVFKQMLINYLGDKGANNAIKSNASIDYVLGLITNLPTNNSFLKTHSFNDFENTQRMPDPEIKMLQKILLQSFEKLQSAINNDNLIETQPWGKFYWISEDLLPQ